MLSCTRSVSTARSKALTYAVRLLTHSGDADAFLHALSEHCKGLREALEGIEAEAGSSRRQLSTDRGQLGAGADLCEAQQGLEAEVGRRDALNLARDDFTLDALNLAQDNVNLADGGRTRMQETHVNFARDNVNLDVNFAQDQVKLARGMLHKSEGGRGGGEERAR